METSTHTVTKLEHYKSIKYFTTNDINYSINHAFLTNELAWLYTHIDKINHFRKYNIIVPDEIYQNIATHKYCELLIYIKQLPKLYIKVQEYTNSVNTIIEHLEDIGLLNDPVKAFYEKVLFEMNDGFLQKLESELNAYFILPSRTDTEYMNQCKYENVLEYYDILMYAFHVVITHIDDIEFDLFAK